MSTAKKDHLHLISVANKDFVPIAEKGLFLLPPLLLHRVRFSETNLLTCDVQVKEAAYSIIQLYITFLNIL